MTLAPQPQPQPHQEQQLLLESTYPDLFARHRWGNVTLTGFHLHDGWPKIDLVQSVNVVPFVGERCIVIGLEDEHTMLPGGTREPGESLLETAQRELMEESGTTFETCTPFAYWNCHSDDELPWRPFLAHPDFLRVVCFADVAIEAAPTNPGDAEQVTEVALVTLDEAIARFAQDGRPELGAIYALAAELRAEISE